MLVDWVGKLGSVITKLGLGTRTPTHTERVDTHTCNPAWKNTRTIMGARRSVQKPWGVCLCGEAQNFDTRSSGPRTDLQLKSARFSG